MSRVNSTPQQQPGAAIPCACGSYNGMPPSSMASYQPMHYQQMFTSPPLPTGFPTGGTTTPLLPAQNGMPAIPLGELPPTTLLSPLYTPGFLRTQIGKKIRVEFLVGTGTLIDRTGTLLAVGASYILIRLQESDDEMMCDIYSIKFVTIFY